MVSKLSLKMKLDVAVGALLLPFIAAPISSAQTQTAASPQTSVDLGRQIHDLQKQLADLRKDHRR